MLISSRNVQLLNLNPVVAVVDDVFDASLAQHIIQMGESSLKRGGVVDPAGGSRISEVKTNENAPIRQWTDPLVTDLISKISELVRLPPENTEPCKLLRYQGEQKFDAHSDAFHNSRGGNEALSRGGQRLFTTLCYLNDVEEGGETEFPKLKLKIKSKLGRVLIFGNTILGTSQPHPHSHHAGRSVTKGEKYAMATWWRQVAYHVQREYPEQEGEMQVF